MKPHPSHWHHLSTDTVLERFGVALNQGLSDATASQRHAETGDNCLTPRRGKSPLRLLLNQLNQPLVYLLIVAGSITGALGEWVDCSVIMGVVVINAVMGFLQESNALKAIDALSRVLSLSATVLRDGSRKQIAASALVPGDLVCLQSGDKVPADLRLLQLRELRIDESALTGESLPVTKQLQALALDTVLADRSNMAFCSTLVTYGSAIGLVVDTGDRTEIGRINRLIANTTELDTPLTEKMAQFSLRLLWIILGCATITFAVGVWRGESLLEMFITAVALAVGAIPEGLPAAMTITLAIGVSRMAKRHAIVRKLPAVETLGSTTVICSDKTGTLTQNQMTVQAIVAGGQPFSVTGTGYTPDGHFQRAGETIDPHAYPALMECLTAGLLCNDARLLPANTEWHIEGDPTEAALLVSAHKAGLHQQPICSHQPRLDVIPFESQQQFMATLHHNRAKDARHIYLKGAAESVLARCNSAFDSHMQVIALDKPAISQHITALTAQGWRVLAFARMDHTDNAVDDSHIGDGMTFLGLQAMIDPPRPEAATAITACYQAGIAVKMITGDHPLTAQAIAKQLGMRGSDTVISGAELQALAPTALTAVVEQYALFARISPEQKLQLVQALQAKGHIVAMTGDGVNDAPALRQANIGIAMGLGGTEVAKEAAAMVLTDDHFATIKAAVEEGRGVFDNLVKFIAWTLPTNLGEGLLIMAAVIGNTALPITPLQILWINMTTAVLLGLMLAFEPKEPGLMLRQPRQPQQAILTRHLAWRIAWVGLLLLSGAFGLFEWELSHGESLAAARTAAVNVFVCGQVSYVFNCRSLRYSIWQLGVFSNPWLIAGASLMLALQGLLTYWPPMQALFGTAAIGSSEWLLIGGISLLIYGVIGLEKRLLLLFAK